MKRRSDCTSKTTSSKDELQNSKGIRTRLSTGTLIMSGTSTASPNDFQIHERSNSPPNTSSAGSDQAGGKDSALSSSRKRKLIDDKEFEPSESSNTPPKRKKIGRNDGTGEGNKNDYFCWVCHKEGMVICCELCPRVFHAKCLSIEKNVPQDWVCPECEKIMKAECTDTRSKTMTMISVGTLCTLLRYALDRMRTVGSETFEHMVDQTLFPNYSDYVFHPMSLSLLEKNIKRKNYGCTEAFLADAKWILHNSCVFNGAQNKITLVARALLKVCKHEMSEIEVCPDCYYNSCLQSDSDWFCEPCQTPHPLVWAKLKGYPFWPAKALREVNDQVDVRFFGAHDRSWVPVASCFMLSKVCPVIVKKGRGGMQEAMREVDVHIKKLREKLGSFEYAPFRTPYTSDPVYSKIKNNTNSSGESSVHTGHGKMAGKSKAGDGRPGEKHSNVSKTAMALKSKYIGITSRKGMQQPSGTLLKTTGSTSQQQQQRQIIYLKPMPKGVFLLSEQTVEPITSSSVQGTVLRSGVPDLQLAKSMPNKVKPSVLPSSSKSDDDKDSEVSPQCSKAKGVLTKGQTSREETQLDNMMQTDGDRSTESEQNTCGRKGQESLEDHRLSLNNMDQNVLISKDLTTDVDSSATVLKHCESELLPSQADTDLDIQKSDEDNSSSQELTSGQSNQQNQVSLENSVSSAEGILHQDLASLMPTIDDNRLSHSTGGGTLESSTHLSVSATCQRDDVNSNFDVHKETCNSITSINTSDSSVSISSCLDNSVKETSKLRKMSSNCDNSIADASMGLSSSSITEGNVVLAVCAEKSLICEQTGQNLGKDGVLESSLTCDDAQYFLSHVNSDKDNITNHLSKMVLKPPGDENGVNAQLIRQSGDCVSITSSSSSSSCMSSSLAVSSSSMHTSLTSVNSVSPGSKYKDSLQKVIDSCKAKLGIDETVLSNTDEDALILEEESDDQEDIVISDNDNDSDVMLMDIDDESQEYIKSTPTKMLQKTSKSNSAEPTFVADLHESNTNQHNQHSNTSLQLGLNKETFLSSHKPALENLKELNNSAQEKQHNRSANSSESLNTASSKIANPFADREIHNDLNKSSKSSTDTFLEDQSNNNNVCLGATYVLRNKVMDDEMGASHIISEKPVSDNRKDINSESIARVLQERPNRVALKDQQAAVVQAEKSLTADDEALVISIIDDDNESCVDDMTLDMEVVCADDPGDDSEDLGVNHEISGDEANLVDCTNRNDKNCTPTRIHSPAQDVDKTPITTNVEHSQDILGTNSVSYPTLRVTLDTTAPVAGVLHKVSAQLTASKTSEISNLNTASNATTSCASNTSPDSSTQPSSSSAKQDILILPQNKTRPRILSSTFKRKTSSTQENSILISLDECENSADVGSSNNNKTVTSSKASTDKTGNTDVVELGVEEQTSITDGEELHQTVLDRRENLEDEPDPSTVLRDKIKSIVKNRYSLFENFLKDQLNDMAEEVKRATKRAIPEQVEHSKRQKTLERKTKEFNQKTVDLWKIMDATLKESHESFKLQKAALAEKLKEEFGKELQKAIANTKKQQWCAECWKEAVYYCCWNTSYCSYLCQQKHWPTHMPKCMQTQPQQQATQAVSRGSKIISTLNAVNGAKGISSTSVTSSNTVATTATTSQLTASVTSLTASKTVQRIPTVSIVSPSQWKTNEETAKGKKMFSLVSPQSLSSTTAPVNTLSVGPSHFQFQYMQQQGTAATLPPQVQVMGANPSSIPLLMPSMISPSQNQVAPPVQLLHNTPMIPFIQRPQQPGVPQPTQAQQIGGARYILPGTFGAFMRPGGSV